MSFSFIVKEEDVESTLSAAIDSKIAQIPNPAGKAEAEKLASMLPGAISALGVGGKEFSSVSVSGSASDGAASLSLHMTFKRPAATPTVVEEPALNMASEEPAPQRPESVNTSDEGKAFKAPKGPDNPKKP